MRRASEPAVGISLLAAARLVGRRHGWRGRFVVIASVLLELAVPYNIFSLDRRARALRICEASLLLL